MRGLPNFNGLMRLAYRNIYRSEFGPWTLKTISSNTPLMQSYGTLPRTCAQHRSYLMCNNTPLQEQGFFINAINLCEQKRCYYRKSYYGSKKSRKVHKRRQKSPLFQYTQAPVPDRLTNYLTPVSEEEASVVINLQEIRDKMDSILANLKIDYISLVVPTSAEAFDQMEIYTPDGTFQLNQLGEVDQTGPHLIVINMATSPQYLPAVINAIRKHKSGLHLKPHEDANTLYVPIPEETTKQRVNMAISAKTKCESASLKLRDIQDRCIRKVCNEKDQPVDLISSVKEMILSITSNYTIDAEVIMETKMKELVDHKPVKINPVE